MNIYSMSDFDINTLEYPPMIGISRTVLRWYGSRRLEHLMIYLWAMQVAVHKPSVRIYQGYKSECCMCTCWLNTSWLCIRLVHLWENSCSYVLCTHMCEKNSCGVCITYACWLCIRLVHLWENSCSVLILYAHVWENSWSVCITYAHVWEGLF